MLLGPIVHRELITATRRRRTYGGRTVVPLVILLVLGCNYYGWRYFNGGPSTVQEAATFGRLTFAQVAWAQVLATLLLVPGVVAPSPRSASGGRWASS